MFGVLLLLSALLPVVLDAGGEEWSDGEGLELVDLVLDNQVNCGLDFTL